MKRCLAMILTCALLLTVCPLEGLAAELDQKNQEAEADYIEQPIGEVEFQEEAPSPDQPEEPEEAPPEEPKAEPTTPEHEEVPKENAVQVQSTDTYTEGDYTYTVADGVATITKYTGSATNLTIPDTLDGYTVRVIGYSTFRGYKNLQSVQFPDNVTKIDQYAFQDCSKLKNVKLPKDLETLGAGAFKNCDAITAIKIPKSLQDTNSPFQDCDGLSYVQFEEGATRVVGRLFYGCTGLTSIVLPDTIVEIGNYAFNNCKNLQSVQFSDSIKKIEWYAFQDCSKLKNVKLPKDLETLGAGAFKNCDAITAIKIPKSLQDTNSPFQDCDGLSDVQFEEGTMNVVARLFYGCTGLTSIVIPDTITEIGQYAFSECTKLSNVTLPGNLQVLGTSTFKNCDALTSIKIPKSLGLTNTFGIGPFNSCDNLKNVNFEKGIAKIPSFLFEYCTGLEEITIPDTVTSIGSYTFGKCDNLQIVEIPDSVTSIESYTFWNCSRLQTIKIPDSVTSIGQYAFSECTKLSNVTLPGNLQVLGTSAFKNCDALTSIEIPKSLGSTNTFGIGSFDSCDNLKNVSFEKGITKIPSFLFEYCTGLEEITIPDSVTAIGHYAFANCENLRYVQVTDGVKSIESSAFENSQKVTFNCPLNSIATIYAIDHDISFILSDSLGIGSDGMLERTKTSYYADMNSLEVNGYISMSLSYQAEEAQWNEARNKTIKIRIPKGTEVVESSLKVDGKLCTNFSVKDQSLTIPVTQAKGSVRFYLKMTESSLFQSYALLTYQQGSATQQEVIGVLSEKMEAHTLYEEEYTGAKSITVNGSAPAGSQVTLSVNGVKTLSVTANKVGAYQGELSLDAEGQDGIYTIQATCQDSTGKELTASRSVVYQEQSPVLTGFKFYVDGRDDKMIDLFEYGKKGIKPSITHTGSQHPYKFEVEFQNPQAIDKLYITSLRNNVKNVIEAKYDAELGKFIAIGYFDKNNKTYVPGKLGIEYTLSHEKVLVGQEDTWDQVNRNLDDNLKKSKVTHTTTEEGTEGKIDLSNVSKDLSNVILDYSIDMLDETTGSQLGDLFDNVDTVKKLFSYVLPGVEDKKYYAHLDMSDPTTVTMIVADGLELSSKAVKFSLSLTESSSSKYNSLASLSDALSGYTTSVKLINKMLAIEDDNEQLRDEIWRMPSIKNKEEALKKADELKNDQIIFTFLTTMLPIIVGSTAVGAASAPVVLFSAMIGILVSVSDFFWKLRIGQIKGESYKINWHIDPSGFVYDAETWVRLPGVKTTAFYIPVPDKDDIGDFWSIPPSESEEGTLWNAAEYSAENPLYTDEEGRYAWDVPEGWWRVKYEKEGYITAWSDWLPVPPPQTEVNVGLQSQETKDFSIYLQDLEKQELTNGQLDLRFTLTNRTEHAKTVQFYVGAYTKEGKLLDGKLLSTTVNADSEREEPISLRLPEGTGISDLILKAFTLTDGTIVPMRKAWEYIYS